MLAVFQCSYTFLYTISSRISTAAVLKRLHSVTNNENSLKFLKVFVHMLIHIGYSNPCLVFLTMCASSLVKWQLICRV